MDHDSFICVTWLRCQRTTIQKAFYKKAHSCICHGSFIYVPWLMYMWHVFGADALPFKLHSREVWRIRMCAPWLIYVCAMTHSYVCHDFGADVLPCKLHSKEAWRIRMCMCAMNHWYVCHDSFMCVTWLGHRRYTIQTAFQKNTVMCHDSFIYVPWLICKWRAEVLTCYYSHYILETYGAFICVPWLTYIYAMTHLYVTGWGTDMLPFTLWGGFG